jgi:hypothetical protein
MKNFVKKKAKLFQVNEYKGSFAFRELASILMQLSADSSIHSD